MIVVLALSALAGCGSEESEEAKAPPVEKTVPLPMRAITAPLSVRDRLLHDMSTQNAKARDRNRAMQQVIEGR